MGRHRQKNQRPHSPLRGTPSSSVPYRHFKHHRTKVPQKPAKKSNPLLFFFFLLILIGGAFYYLYGQSKNQTKNNIDAKPPADTLTLQERIQKKNKALRLQKNIQQREMKAEQLKKPVEKVDLLEPEPATLDRGLHIPKNNSMKEVFEDLKQHPYKSDLYEDPEHTARRQMEHQEWLEEHLKEKNKKEREEFIKKFVQIAQEQGYKVHFTKDMQVLLQPIEKQEEEEQPEEIKVIYE